MEWFEGNIVDAIQRAKSNKSIFVVFIKGDDDATKTVEETMNDDSVARLAATNHCVAVKLDVKSQSGQQFAQIYPVICVPSVYYINGINGMPLEVCGGPMSSSAMSEKFSRALELLWSNVAGGSTGNEGTQQTNSTSTAAAAADVNKTAADESFRKNEQSHVTSTAANESSTSAPTNSAGPAANTASNTTANTAANTAANSTDAANNQEPLEERKERVEARLAQRREQKEEESKEKEKQEEIERRKLGRDMNKLQNWKQERERKEIEESMKKDREEEKRAREKVRQDIERDRRERAAKFEREKENERVTAEIKRESKTAAENEEKAKQLQQRMEKTRLQFRLPDGSSVTQTFQSSDQLSLTRDFISQRLSTTHKITLMCTFPKRTFTDDDMSSTLLDLQLTPSATLIVLLASNSSTVDKGDGTSEGFLAYLFSLLLTAWLFFTRLFTSSPSPQNPTPPSNQPSNNRNQGKSRDDAQKTPRSGSGVVRRREGNIHRLKFNDDDDDSDDDNATWNGNSTQQM